MVGFSGAVCFDSDKTAKLDVARPYLRSVATAKLTLAILARNHGHQAGNGLSLRPVIAAPCLFIGPSMASSQASRLDPQQQNRLARSLAITLSSRIRSQTRVGPVKRSARFAVTRARATPPHFKEASSSPWQRRVGRLFCVSPPARRLLAATTSGHRHAIKSYLGMKDGYIPDEQPVSLPRHVGSQ